MGSRCGDALLAETAGKPVLVAEILRHLAETGAIYQQTTALGRCPTPSGRTARQCAGRSSGAASPDSVRTPTDLALGAVIGRDFDVRSSLPSHRRTRIR